MEGKLMVTENTPYRNKKYIVEDFEFDTKFKTEKEIENLNFKRDNAYGCLLYTSPSPRDPKTSRMPSSA